MEQYKFGKIVDYEGTVTELAKFVSLELNEPTGKVQEFDKFDNF